jgi:methionyl-tRNA formyltransferase
LNWAIINGEERFGVTVHYVDEGIDTGDIIFQEWVEIHKSDNYQSILKKAHGQCAETLHKALTQIQSGTVKRIPQHTIHPTGFYCGGRTLGDEWVNWELPSKEIFNFVRGISIPAPGARTMLGNREIAILETEICPDAINYIGTTGEVVGKNTDGVVVKTGDSTLLVKQVADIDEQLLHNHRTPKFKIGTRFGYNMFEKIKQLEERIKRIEQFQLKRA